MSYREHYIQTLSSCVMLRVDSHHHQFKCSHASEIARIDGNAKISFANYDSSAKRERERELVLDFASLESTSENRDRGTLESCGISQRPVYRVQVLASPLSPSFTSSPSFLPSLLSRFLSFSLHPPLSRLSLSFTPVTRRRRRVCPAGTHLAHACSHACTHALTRASHNAQDGLHCE